MPYSLAMRQMMRTFEDDKDIAAAMKATGRSCDTCAMCCKIPPVEELPRFML
jgi:hypothetical protein